MSSFSVCCVAVMRLNHFSRKETSNCCRGISTRVLRSIFRTLSNIYMELFKKQLVAQRSSTFREKAPSQIFDLVLTLNITLVYSCFWDVLQYGWKLIDKGTKRSKFLILQTEKSRFFLILQVAKSLFCYMLGVPIRFYWP